MRARNFIQNQIDNNDVCLFMKGTPDISMWIFNGCNKYVKAAGVNFQSVMF